MLLIAGNAWRWRKCDKQQCGKKKAWPAGTRRRTYAKNCGHALFINKTNKPKVKIRNKVIHPHLGVCVKKRPLFPRRRNGVVCRRPQFLVVLSHQQDRAIYLVSQCPKSHSLPSWTSNLRPRRLYSVKGCSAVSHLCDLPFLEWILLQKKQHKHYYFALGWFWRTNGPSKNDTRKWLYLRLPFPELRETTQKQR